jgi:hypothetical protein
MRQVSKTLLFSEEKRSKKDFYSMVARARSLRRKSGASLRPRSASKSLFASFSSEKEES